MKRIEDVQNGKHKVQNQRHANFHRPNILTGPHLENAEGNLLWNFHFSLQITDVADLHGFKTKDAFITNSFFY